MKGWYKISEGHLVQVDKNWQVCDFDSPLRKELLNEFKGQPIKLAGNDIFEIVEKYEKENNQ